MASRHTVPEHVYLYPYMNTVLEGGGGQSVAHPNSCTPRPRQANRYPMYKRLGELWGQSGWIWNISPPPGFDIHTVQPVARCYGNYAILGRPQYRKTSKCHKVRKFPDTNSDSTAPCCRINAFIEITLHQTPKKSNGSVRMNNEPKTL